MGRDLPQRRGAWRVPLAIAMGLSAAGMGPAGAQGTSPLLALFPAARRAPAPPWLKAGTRLTYYGASAAVPAGAYSWVRQKKGRGRWVDQNGNSWERADAQGASGHGYNQFNVVALDQTTVVLESRVYGFLNYTGPLKLVNTTTALGLPGAGNDLWVHPAVLQQAAERREPEATIVRMPFEVDGKTYKALRIQTRTANGDVAQVYDLATGILLHSRSQSSVKGRFLPKDAKPGEVQTAGRACVDYCYLKGVRQLRVPWAQGAVPPWLAQVRRLHYRGAVIYLATGLRYDSQLMLQITRRGADWVEYTQTSQFGSGPTAARAVFRRVSGRAQFGGMWVPPDGLAALRLGQVLDRDPLAKVTVSVTHVGPTPQGRAAVRITEAGPVHQIHCLYDRATGQMIGMGVIDRQLSHAAEYLLDDVR